MTQQHHRVTIETVLTRYKCGKMSAYQALWHFFHVRLAPGWEQNFNFSEVRRLFGIPHTTFWRAMRRLRFDGEILITSKLLGCKVRLPYESSDGNGWSEDDQSDFPYESESVSALDPSPRRASKENNEAEHVSGRGFGNRAQLLAGSKPKKKEGGAYALFLETLALEQRQYFEAFCDRKVASSTFPINSSIAWLNAHYLDYWAEFERQYVKSQSTAAAPDIPQQLKDAIAAGKARVERYFSGGEFRTGVCSLSGKGWFKSIDEWLASC